MTPDEMKDVAKALEQVPGLKGIEFRDVRRLARLLHDHPELGSIELKGFFGTGVVITRTQQTVIAAAAPAPLAPAALSQTPQPAPAGGTAAAPEAVQGNNLTEIKSPMVGTFYARPAPDSEPYVKVGARVSPGDTVCIIEAMKIMNEIEAEVSGVVSEVLVDDASPVEYGQVLYRVDQNG